MRTSEGDSQMPVKYFIHYPQIIHTAFRVAVYPIPRNPARVFDGHEPTFPHPLVLIFSWNTCIVKGNRNPASHA